jgi:PTS system cellobiose-specific IIB component
MIRNLKTDLAYYRCDEAKKPERKIIMEKLNVLLVCGSGASSGFMAANMRKAASKQGLDIDIKARSESEIENYIDEINVLMVGPHLAYILDEVEEYTHGEDVKVILMKPDYYSVLNGEMAIAHLLEEMEK